METVGAKLQFHQETFVGDAKYNKWYSQDKVQVGGGRGLLSGVTLQSDSTL